MTTRRGIVLAGGSGTRLAPVSGLINKQLLPVYDKPMIYYPISVLMLANIRDILIISTPRDRPLLRDHFGDGKRFGVNFEYREQANPNGIAEAFIIGADFIGNHSSALVLGDNIFYGHGFTDTLLQASNRESGATVFSYPVLDPTRFGIVEVNESGLAISMEEKPNRPRSNTAVVGLYFYDAQVIEFARSINRSPRDELEITDINKCYLERGQLRVERLGRGFAWLDTGTFGSLLDASNYVATIQRRQGLQIACLEEIAFGKGWIDIDQLLGQAEAMRGSEYGRYLAELARNARG
jgi:glucose-1-phosphate thymidylyltransferase